MHVLHDVGDPVQFIQLQEPTDAEVERLAQLLSLFSSQVHCVLRAFWEVTGGSAAELIVDRKSM